MATVRSSVRDLRQKAGLQQQDLATAVGASRQSVSAIEAGETVPSTALALRLARALDCRVEDLFVLEGADDPLAVSVAAVGAAPPPAPTAGGRVRLGLVGGTWVAHALDGDSAAVASTPADGIVAPARGKRRAPAVTPLRDIEAIRANLLVAGCDPALGLLAGHLLDGAARVRLHWIEAASEPALAALERGLVHVAGLHLFDEPTGEHNVPAVRRRFGERPMVLVNLATWQQGFVTRQDSSRRIRRPDDLAERGVKLCLRETGSGARALLDRLLAGRRIPLAKLAVAETVFGHHAVARSVAHGTTDVGIATAAAAAAFGLAFLPLAEDRFDLAMFAETAHTPSGQRLLETLSSARFRRDIGALRGYGTTRTGKTHSIS